LPELLIPRQARRPAVIGAQAGRHRLAGTAALGLNLLPESAPQQ
jgi:hypothetical protein